MGNTMEKDTLNFSMNWNGKLFTDCFTTLRRTTRYSVGQVVMVYLDGEYLYDAVVVAVQPRWLQELDEYECHLDTGYSAAETRGIVAKMYQDATPKTTMYKILLKRVKGSEHTNYNHLVRKLMPPPKQLSLL